MSRLEIIHTWKGPEYSLSLTQTDRAQLPVHPPALIGLRDAQLEAVEGGMGVADILWNIATGLASNYIYGCATGSGLCNWMLSTDDVYSNPNAEGM